MWRTSISLVLLLLTARPGLTEERFLKFETPSKFLPGPRIIRIYLPPSYHQETTRRYPVLYLHDGQNVFSTAGTNICFGWGNWEVDKTVDELCRTKKMQEIILVAMDNSPARFAEYCGRHHSEGTGTNTAFENYTAFLIQELKPRIDSEYRTRPEPANTGIMGSSLGGICSIILAWDQSAHLRLCSDDRGSATKKGRSSRGLSHGIPPSEGVLTLWVAPRPQPAQVPSPQGLRVGLWR